MTKIMEPGNPVASRNWTYVVTLVLIPLASVVGCVVVTVMRPEKDNSSLVTQILGFGVTITMATMAYLKSSDTREVVNSRMDEFKRTLQLTADAAIAGAHAEGKAEGRVAADQRTDLLAGKLDGTHNEVKVVGELLKTHDQWERDTIEERKKVRTKEPL
jgi:hypothetical protein